MLCGLFDDHKYMDIYLPIHQECCYLCSWICRYENIMVNLDVQLWELGTQRLHQGLSETILVNTLTEVRDFKTFLTKTDDILWKNTVKHQKVNLFLVRQ